MNSYVSATSYSISATICPKTIAECMDEVDGFGWLD